MEGVKGEGIATAAAEAEGEADAHTVCMRTNPEAFPNTSPRWEDPSKIICWVSTMVALYQLLQEDRQPAEVAAKTQRTQTNTKYSTTGMYVIHIDLTSRTVTIQPHAEAGRWITRRGLHTKNAQAYINAGYAPTTRGMHSNILPTNF